MIPFMPSRIGSYWLNDIDGDTEIDVMAVDNQNKRVFAGECRYRTRKADISDLKKHISKDISSVYKGGNGKLYYYFILSMVLRKKQ